MENITTITKNTPRGMRFIYGNSDLDGLIVRLTNEIQELGFKKLHMPSVFGLSALTEKSGEEIISQIYAFKDKKGRDLCLAPEGTALAREWFLNSGLSTAHIFYLQKFYRYERPQAGRYREFYQFGVESMGREQINTFPIMKKLLKPFNVEIAESVKRGLDYYIADGFEASIPTLGAQKQVAGGGAYDCGNGFAIGIERLLLSINKGGER